MVSVEELARMHGDEFARLIEEKNAMYGYLGFSWDGDIRRLFEEGSGLSLRVYFDDSQYSSDMFFDAGSWTPEGYMAELCFKSAEAALDLYNDNRIGSLLPDCLELCS